MVTLRNSKRVEPNGAAAISAPQKQKHDAPKKRAASEDRTNVKSKKPKNDAGQKTCPSEQDGSLKVGRPQTPPPAGATQDQQRTPGRVGPIKKECDCTPDIKPFKGEPGHKVRKTAFEKEQEYTDFVMKHEGHAFHELHVCYAKGPNGSPTYDKSGFELDYDKVAQWMKPVSRRQLKARWTPDKVDKRMEEDSRKSRIFFGTPEDATTDSLALDAAADKISKDLQIPYHKVGLAEFEEWERRGFPKENLHNVTESLTKEARDRLMRLMSGAALRK